MWYAIYVLLLIVKFYIFLVCCTLHLFPINCHFMAEKNVSSKNIMWRRVRTHYQCYCSHSKCE